MFKVVLDHALLYYIIVYQVFSYIMSMRKKNCLLIYQLYNWGHLLRILFRSSIFAVSLTMRYETRYVTRD